MSHLKGVFWPGFAPLILAIVALVVAVQSAPASADALQAAPSLSVSNCLKVSEGDVFDVDITAEGVGSLLAWEVYFAYNRNLLEVTDKSVDHLLATGNSTRVVDFSDPVPNSTGFYRTAAADLGDARATESNGVLVRLTLRAKAKGVSPSAIYRGDYDGNGSIDFGPTLTAIDRSHVGDTDGDDRFDGTIHSGQIAIGSDCVEPAPVIQPDDIGAQPPTDNDPSDPLLDIEGSGTGSDTQGEDSGTGTDSGAAGEGPSVLSGGEETEGNTDGAASSGETGTRGQNNAQRQDPASKGGSSVLPMALIIAGLAVAAAGGITYVLIRSTREPL